MSSSVTCGRGRRGQGAGWDVVHQLGQGEHRRHLLRRLPFAERDAPAAVRALQPERRPEPPEDGARGGKESSGGLAPLQVASKALVPSRPKTAP